MISSCRTNVDDEVLEVAFLNWLEIRLLLQLKISREFNLQNLFSIVGGSIPPPFLKLFSRNYSIDYNVPSTELSHDSHKSKTKFIKELKKQTVTNVEPFKILIPKAGEAFDVGLVVHDSDENLIRNSTYLFIDLKSKIEPPDQIEQIKVDNIKKLPGSGKQYKYMKKLMMDTELKFVYIYASTANLTGCLPDENVIIMGREEVLEFLGPCAEVYIAARAAFNNPVVNTTITR